MKIMGFHSNLSCCALEKEREEEERDGERGREAGREREDKYNKGRELRRDLSSPRSAIGSQTSSSDSFINLNIPQILQRANTEKEKFLARL